MMMAREAGRPEPELAIGRGLTLLCDEGIAFVVTRHPPTVTCLHTVECDGGNDL